LSAASTSIAGNRSAPKNVCARALCVNGFNALIASIAATVSTNAEMAFLFMLKSRESENLINTRKLISQILHERLLRFNSSSIRAIVR